MAENSVCVSTKNDPRSITVVFNELLTPKQIAAFKIAVKGMVWSERWQAWIIERDGK